MAGQNTPHPTLWCALANRSRYASTMLARCCTLCLENTFEPFEQGGTNPVLCFSFSSWFCPDFLQFLSLAPSLETSDFKVLLAALGKRRKMLPSLLVCRVLHGCRTVVLEKEGGSCSSCQLPFRSVPRGDCTEQKGSPLTCI